MVDLNESFSSQGSITMEVPELDLQPDLSFERKFLVIPNDTETIRICALAHPKTGTLALYNVGDDFVHELLNFDTNGRSVFFGNSVIQNSHIHLSLPIHPLFMLIPYVCDKKPTNQPIESVFADGSHINISQVLKMPKTLDWLKMCADVDETEMKISYNYNKLIGWLCKRFEIFVKAAKTHNEIPLAFDGNEDGCRYYTFGIFCDYIPTDIAAILRNILCIKKPVIKAPFTPPMFKRRIEANSADTKMTAQMSAKKRKLKKASVGTQPLTSFFTKPTQQTTD